MSHVPYERWITFMKRFIQHNQLNIYHIVDLGCGTDEITIQIAKEGFHMTGVDISSDMLAVSSQKSLEQQVPITWIQQNIRELSGFEEVDVCISFCDVMNYIT